MLNPARLRINLGELLLRHGVDPTTCVQHDAARTGFALIHGEKIGHGARLAMALADRVAEIMRDEQVTAQNQDDFVALADNYLLGK